MEMHTDFHHSSASLLLQVQHKGCCVRRLHAFESYRTQVSHLAPTTQRLMPVDLAFGQTRVIALSSSVLCDVPVGSDTAEVWLFWYRGIAQSIESDRAKCAAPV